MRGFVSACHCLCVLRLRTCVEMPSQEAAEIRGKHARRGLPPPSELQNFRATVAVEDCELFLENSHHIRPQTCGVIVGLLLRSGCGGGGGAAASGGEVS